MDTTTKILESVKQTLGLKPDYEAFDNELLMHINGAFATLSQIADGLPPCPVVEVDTTWDSYAVRDPALRNLVYTYISKKTRLDFDPPAMSFQLKAIQDSLEEVTCRISYHQ